MENKNLTIKKSRNGKGVFTKRSFTKNEKIFSITGKFITCDIDENIAEEIRNNAYRYDEDLYISPKGKIGDFVNHSCNPNSKMVKGKNVLFVVAIKSIPKSREVTFDYSTMVAPDDIWTMRCNCGSRKCRRVIGQFKSLPKKTKEKYLSLGMVPSYILN